MQMHILQCSFWHVFVQNEQIHVKINKKLWAIECVYSSADLSSCRTLSAVLEKVIIYTLCWNKWIYTKNNMCISVNINKYMLNMNKYISKMNN